MTKFYLHIGMNKTGSSAIQSYFHYNRKHLAELGVLWPQVGLGSPIAGNGYHYALSEALGFGPKPQSKIDGAHIESLDTQLKTEVAQEAPRTVILSSEFFILNRDVSPVKEFFNGLDLKIIVHLRRHDKWWPSLYAQAIKSTPLPPWKRTFSSYYEFQNKRKAQHLGFGPLLQAWSECFGKENIVVCPYEDQQNKPDLIRHMLGIVGEASVADHIAPSLERVNKSLSPRALSLVDLVQRAKIDPTRKETVIRTIIKEDEGGSSMDIVPAKVRRQLVDENADDYEWIAREFLNRPDGKLFYDPLPEIEDQGTEDTTLPSPRAIEFFSRHFTTTN